MYPNPLRQVDSEPPFVLSSLMAAEASGTTTAAPLHLSGREWPPPNDVANLPLKVIHPMTNNEPPNNKAKFCCRKCSIRCSGWKRSFYSSKPPPPTKTSSLSLFLQSQSALSPFTAKLQTIGTSQLQPPQFTVYFRNIKLYNLESPLSPSKITRNVDLTGLQQPCLYLQPISTHVETSNLVYYHLQETITPPTTSPKYSKYSPLPPIISDFTKIIILCWISIINSSHYSNLHVAFHPIAKTLRHFLLYICEWESTNFCLLHKNQSPASIKSRHINPSIDLRKIEYNNE